MQIQQLSVKIFTRQRDVAQDPLIPIFHRWIRETRLRDTLLIDVADYRHVPDGPGVMLIGHEAHYGLDAREGELGLVFARKRDTIGDVGPRFKEAFGALLRAAALLESEPAIHGQLSFDPGRLEVRVMSRLIAPNTAETFAAFAPLLRGFLSELYGGADSELEHIADPRQPLGVRVRIAGTHDLAALSARL